MAVKVVTAEVRVIGRTVLESSECYDYLGERGWKTGIAQNVTDADALVEFAGKVCYNSFPGREDNKQYVENILSYSHGSVLEHANFTLLITGVSRTLTHELVRHRAGFAFSQESQRYVEAKDLEVVMPPAIIEQSYMVQEWWVKGLVKQHEDYQALLETLEENAPQDLPKTDRLKWARSAARSVLPGCTATKIVVTANARAWRHFIELRGGPGTDLEIRSLAIKILEALEPLAPNIFQGFTVEDGYVMSKYHKV